MKSPPLAARQPPSLSTSPTRSRSSPHQGGRSAQFGKIDILVNNAGITRDQLIMRMKRADWDSVLQTNLTSAYLCTQVVRFHAQATLGKDHQHHQRLRSDGAGRAGELRGIESRADRTDHGRRARTGIAQHYLQRGCAGLHRNRHDRALGDEFKQNAAKQIPLGRVGSPADVASAVAFLASDEASYITGHVLNVNGGMLMG
jgi:3-oxoacyl-[acyl-carrier protein] reductase